MPRSVRDSEDETESKSSRRIRTLNARAVVDSPVRRSSRIKSAKQNKSSPESAESDTSSVSNSQSSRSTRQRRATIDNVSIGMQRSRQSRRTSMSSDISEATDIDVIGTPKKVTRRSLAASVTTPTKTSTRTSRYLTRAGSETTSPSTARVTRRTRASSIEPEIISEQNNSRPSTPSKFDPANIRRRASIVPSRSPVKEEAEESNDGSYTLLDTVLVEVDEITSLGNSDSSPDKALHSQESQEINKEYKSIDEDKIKEDSDHVTSSYISSDEIHSKHSVTTVNRDEYFAKEDISEDNLLSIADTTTGEACTHDTSSSKYKKKSEAEAENDLPLNDTFKTSAVKEIGYKIENLLNMSTEEKRRNSNNKENQTINVINETLAEKNVGPIISSVTSLHSKHMVSTFANKSLNEKEIGSVINETNVTPSKRRYSRESVEITAKCSALSKEIIDNVEEKMDISIDSSSSQLYLEKTDLDRFSLDDAEKKQNLSYDEDNELITADSINKSISSKDDYLELVDKITVRSEISGENEFNKSAVNEINELEKTDKIDDIIIKNKSSNKVILNKISDTSVNWSEAQEINDNLRSFVSQIMDDNEMEPLLEEQDACQDRSKSVDNLKRSDANFKPDHSNLHLDIDVSLKNHNNKSIINIKNKQSSVIQGEVEDNSPASTEQPKKDSPNDLVELASKSSNIATEENNSTSSDVNMDNTVMQDVQSPDVTETPKESTADTSANKTKSKNILLETTMNTKRKSTDISSLNVKENLENWESTDDDSDVDIGHLFQDIPATKWEDENLKKNDNDGNNPLHSDSHLIDKLENESEAECDLVLVDKQAWLAAESMKIAKESQCFDYDSDDTVIMKSRLDAKHSANDVNKLDTIKEDSLMDISDEESTAELVKPRKSLSKRRSECSEDSDGSTSIDISLNNPKIALNRSKNQTASILNKSKPAMKTTERSSETYDSDKDTDANELNRSSITNKKHNTSVQKSAEKRKSLIESSKDTSLKQNVQNTQNISTNTSRTDNSMEKIDDIIDKEQNKKKIEQLLNKSASNKEAETIKSEKEKSLLNKNNNKSKDNASLNCSINKISSSIDNKRDPLNIVDSESNDSEVNIPVMNFKSKKRKTDYSTIVHVGSTSNDSDNDNLNSTDSSSTSEIHISHDFFPSNDSNSIDSDIKREYNLDGAKQKFDDGNAASDECRASELEFSDSDDNGSDLEDFIVHDELVYDLEAESSNDEEDEQSEVTEEKQIKAGNSNDDDQNEVTEEEDLDEDKQNAVNDDEIINEQIKNTDEEIEDAEEENNMIYAKKNANGERSVKERVSTGNKNNTSGKLLKIHEIKEISEHKTPGINKKIDVKANKSYMKENESIKLDSSSLASSNKKSKSDAQNSSKNIVEQDTSNLTSPNDKNKSKIHNLSKDTVEQNLVKQSDNPTIPYMILKRKLSKSHSSMECSTPKTDSIKQKFEIDMEASGITLNTPDKQSSNTNEMKQHSSSKKKKARKDSTSKENISLKESKCIDYKEKSSIHNSLPSDLKEIIGKAGLSKTPYKKAGLHNTINITHTETPTIRHLRKEKLNESAPVSKLREEINQSKKTSPDKKDITQKEIKEMNKKEEAPDRTVSSNNDDMQEPNQQKQKKHKKHMKEKSSENVIDKSLSEDLIEIDIPKKKKKKYKLDQVCSVESDICKDIHQSNESREKKKPVGKTEEVKNVNATNTLQKDIQSNEIRLLQHDKKKKGDIETNLECDISSANNTKKAKRRNIVEDEATMPKEIPKRKEKMEKKKKKTISPSQNVPESEINQIIQCEKLQPQNVIKSKNVAFVKARNEALEAIKLATEKIKNKELKKKKQQQGDNKSNFEKQDKIFVKEEKKEDVGKQKMPSSTCGLKRLPNDIIDNLIDIPIRPSKRRKLLGKEEKQKMPLRSITSTSKFIETKMKDKSTVQLSSCGNTTQFTVINLQKAKKQPLKTADKAISFRQQVLRSDNRQPISSYMMYLQKQRACSNKGFSSNIF